MSLIKLEGKELWEPFLEPFFPAVAKEWFPEMDIVEEKDRILVKADLPGMKQEEIKVEVEDGALVIHGERKRETESKEGRVHRVERSYGSFLRSFSLPANVDEAKVNAAYKNGVLEVILPKREEAKSKQVKVEVKSS